MPVPARKTSAPSASLQVSKAVAGSIATAAALFPANALAQTAAHAAPATPLSQEEIAYRTKMTTFIKQIGETPATLPKQLIQDCALRGSAMLDAIVDIDGKPQFRPLLIKVEPDYLKTLADYASCKTLTNGELRKISNDTQYFLYLLLMGKGAIPAQVSIPVNGYVMPARPTPGASAASGKRADAGPTR